MNCYGFYYDEHYKMNEKIEKVALKFKAFDALVTTVEHLKTVKEKLEADTNAKDKWARRSDIES